MRPRESRAVPRGCTIALEYVHGTVDRIDMRTLLGIGVATVLTLAGLGSAMAEDEWARKRRLQREEQRQDEMLRLQRQQVRLQEEQQSGARAQGWQGIDYSLIKPSGPSMVDSAIEGARRRQDMERQAQNDESYRQIQRERLELERMRMQAHIDQMRVPAAQPTVQVVEVPVASGVSCAQIRAIAVPDTSLEKRTLDTFMRALFAKVDVEEAAKRKPTVENAKALKDAIDRKEKAGVEHITARARRELADQLCPQLAPTASAQ